MHRFPVHPPLADRTASGAHGRALRVTRHRSLRLAVMCLVGLVLAGAASTGPASAAPGSDVGLFGSADPTYDGVFRQSWAILGLDAAGVEPSSASVRWLLGQQCADGSFTAYRPDPTVPCAPVPAESGPQTDATAVAALALASLRASTAQRALTWLEQHQLPGGGWSYTAGDAANSNSTGLALLALRSERPTSASLRRGVAYLTALARPCTAGGGLPYQAGGPANALAAAQGALGLGAVLPIDVTSVSRNPACSPAPRDEVSSYLSTLIMPTGLLPSSFGSGSDPAATAAAVVAMHGMNVGKAAIAKAIRALEPAAATYSAPGTLDPAGLGLLMLAADAAGRSPRTLGGVNLVRAVQASERR